MSKIKLLSIAVIGLLLINIAVVVFLFTKKAPHPTEDRLPRDKHGPPARNGEGPKRIIIDRLGFDEQQVNEYEALIKLHQSSIKLLDDSIRLTKNALYHTLRNENFTGKNSLLIQLDILQKQIELTHYDHFVELKKICKPGQLDEFNKLSDELARLFAPPAKRQPHPKD